MSHSHIDNESARETFVSAYEASQERASLGPKRTTKKEKAAQFFARERLLDAQEQNLIDDDDSFEVVTAPIAFRRYDEYDMMAHRYGADSDIAMSDLVEFGGTVDLSTYTSEPVITHRQIKDLFKRFKKSTLSESEQDLVSQYADDPDCDVPVNPMKEIFTKPETLAQIKRRLSRKFSFYKEDPQILALDAMDDYMASASKIKFVPVKPALEPVDREEQHEIRNANREFKRNQKREQTISRSRQFTLEVAFVNHLIASGILEKEKAERILNITLEIGVAYSSPAPIKAKKSFPKKRIRTRDSIRHQSWSEQLPFCSKIELAYDDYREWNTFEARQMEEDHENEKEVNLQEELTWWENGIVLAQEFQRFEYEEGTAEERRGEAQWRNEQRRDFLRDYRSNSRLDTATWRALCSYDLELTIEADLARLDEEEGINDMLFGHHEAYAQAV